MLVNAITCLVIGMELYRFLSFIRRRVVPAALTIPPVFVVLGEVVVLIDFHGCALAGRGYPSFDKAVGVQGRNP